MIYCGTKQDQIDEEMWGSQKSQGKWKSKEREFPGTTTSWDSVLCWHPVSLDLLNVCFFSEQPSKGCPLQKTKPVIQEISSLFPFFYAWSTPQTWYSDQSHYQDYETAWNKNCQSYVHLMLKVSAVFIKEKSTGCFFVVVF